MNTEPQRPAWRLLATAVLAAVGLCGCGAKSSPPPAADTPHDLTLTTEQLRHIGLYEVRPLGFRPAVEANGVVDFDNDQATSVLAPISGPVTRILVQPGQVVRRGQVLAVVDSPDYAAAVGSYRKAVVVAQNAHRLAAADQALAQHNGIPAREAQQAETDAASADADRDAAYRALAALDPDPRALAAAGGGRRMLGEIRAPIAGTVVERPISPGQLLQAGTTQAFTIANLSRVWVMAQIPASDLGAVRLGDTAQVQTGSGPSLLGQVTNISEEVNPDTRAVLARITVTNPSGLLRKQMYVRVTIQARQAASGLLIPVSAILRDDENLPFVYVAEPRGAFARRRVTLGPRTGDLYLIAEGLQGGERIVSDGGIFLQFMQSQ